MLFLLNFLADEEDNNFFLKFYKMDYHESVSTIDAMFRFESRKQKKALMEVYQKLLRREKDGIRVLLVRAGGAGFRGRVFIYPIQHSLNSKMHVSEVD